MSKYFSLRNLSDYEITRPVADMAAFFGYAPREGAADFLQVSFTAPTLEVNLMLGGVAYTDSSKCTQEQGGITSGEFTRCLKLSLLCLFTRATGERAQLPWGILTGVRPDKLVHKLWDAGIGKEALPQYLAEQYLLPEKQGSLLTDIVALQKKLLPDAERFTAAGIYLGIPFCPSRCSYCSFPAGIVPADEESQQNFINLIEQDILNVVQLLSMHGLAVRSLYIGGGTPTSLNDKVFARLMRLVHKHLAFPSLAEFTVEAGRPDCFTGDKLRAMEEAGVTRVSVNPQTFLDRTLRLIGREHSVRDFYTAYDMVRASSIPLVNMDLIIGLPGESAADITANIDESLRLAPENLTIHTLTLKRGAPLFNMPQASILQAEEATALVEYGQSRAEQAGYAPYYLYRQHYMLGSLANIGYAKPQTQSIYNIQMMEERHPIIGIGPASSSKRPLADGHHLLHVNMPKNIAAYAQNLPDLFRKRSELFD